MCVCVRACVRVGCASVCLGDCICHFVCMCVRQRERERSEYSHLFNAHFMLDGDEQFRILIQTKGSNDS